MVLKAQEEELVQIKQAYAQSKIDFEKAKESMALETRVSHLAYVA